MFPPRRSFSGTMFVIPLILAAGSLPSLISGAPVPSFLSNLVTGGTSTHSLQERSGNTYTVYGGTGEVSDGWPSTSDWISSFEAMFDANKAILQNSCTQWGVPNNSDDEIDALSSSIQSVSSSTGVDARFILAIIMQESNGCVRAPTTNYGVVNPGLMQSHDGSGSCNNGGVLNPCPASEMTQMITDGTAGTSSGDGLKQCFAQAGTTDVSMYYKAARIYNSGSIDPSQNLGKGIATHCYASDIANRLTGWAAGASACDPNTIGDLTGAIIPAGSSGAGATTTSAGKSLPTTTIVAVPIPATSSSVSAPEPTTTASATTAVVTNTVTVVPTRATSTAAAAPVPTSTSGGTAPPSSTAPIYPYAVSSCQEYYTVVAGDYCLLVEAKLGISESQLTGWNSGLDEACTDLWLGYQYCVKA